ncbi:DUF1828 domain-containing protein [Prosthecomicrobium hirschii]|uniref:DUF1828 domain-containing protein n=1 Tax=Prosthecodimorpha hirschii TaxID=665126 RepID=UPI00221F2CAF|nr:DUF1828 domain-containing protein [Prosthecomicrobium hirschii]MCW1844213.1 DUF1828 domain-containing protein [Prosthecomicrobium hirschii]
MGSSETILQGRRRYGAIVPMHPDELKKHLCAAFCGSINVHPVPTGMAVSSAFSDSSGDNISFFITETPDGIQIEDDGSYLSHLIAKDIPIESGTRGQLLDAILKSAGAYWDRDTYEIKSNPFHPEHMSRKVVDFLSSLIRVRDLELITREAVRSTFREDAIDAIRSKYGSIVDLYENEAVSRDFSEFPVDLVIRPKSSVKDGLTGAIYFVNNDAKLNEALLLKMELLHNPVPRDFNVIALVEDPSLASISKKKFQRAQNRSLSMPIFRGDEDAATNRIGRELKLAA